MTGKSTTLPRITKGEVVVDMEIAIVSQDEDGGYSMYDDSDHLLIKEVNGDVASRTGEVRLGFTPAFAYRENPGMFPGDLDMSTLFGEGISELIVVTQAALDAYRAAGGQVRVQRMR